MQRTVSEKVLRACIVHGGKVIEEQRLAKRAALTVGTGASNTFVIAEPSLPRLHKLFVSRRGKYELVLTESMKGKISTESELIPVDFATLKSQGLLKQRGAEFVLPLHDGHRGKVLIGDVTIIFQFVTPPPKPPAPVLPAAARANILRRIDWLLASCLAAVIALEAPVILAVSMAPKDDKEVTLESMDERWAQLIVPDRKPADVKPKQETVAAATTKAETQKAKKPEGETRDEAGKAAQKAARSAEIRKGIANKGILAILGTAGEGSGGGAVADVLGEGGLSGDLDSAFEGIAGVGVATGNQRTARGGGTGQQATIGGLATAGGGAVGLGGKQESKVGTVRTEAPEVDGKLDGEAIARVVRSRMRMVEDCYQRELKRNPQLSGKVEIEFTIGPDGAVTDVRVASNKTGSEEVGQCIVSRMQRWKFPKPAGGSVTVTFPFLFTPSS